MHRNKYFSSKKQTDESEQESDNMNKLKKIVNIYFKNLNDLLIFFFDNFLIISKKFNNENVFNSYYYKNLMRAISKNLKNLS